MERIFQLLVDKCEKLSKEELIEKEGFSANELVEELSMLRNNVSLELNNLVRSGKIVKIKKRPVLYIPRDIIQNYYGNILDRSILEIQSLKDLYETKKKVIKSFDQNPFRLLIGFEGSLKKQVEQAKAAIVYPPKGLHTLILGPTGSGKTLFAHMMHNYAKYAETMDEKSAFVVFNCADYYNNPQLLLSQIFGHIKGAFTGATSEKQGLVEKADGGILFLDEVHRLPPEGQEMIFYFMDNGLFNRLGETERNRKAKVLIISATTEDPSSSFLNTFLRRIPITITMPSFHERQVKEKIELTKFLLGKEAARIHKNIRVHEDVMRALLGSVTFGNIGQLKSNIQLVCAQGFLESIQDPYVNLYAKTLPPEMKEGLSLLSRNRKENEEIAKFIDSIITITGEGNEDLLENDVYELPFDMYKIIEDKARLLKDEGIDKDEINKFVTTDIKVHIKSFYQQVTKQNFTKLSNLVDKKVLQLAEELRSLSQSMLKRSFNDKFIYFVSLHIEGLLNRKNRFKKDIPVLEDIYETMRQNQNEYKVALKMKEIIEERLAIVLPELEVMYLALLLISTDEWNNKGKVGIVVAAHGESTASSMVNVTQELLGEHNIRAVDMPLDVSFHDVFDKIVDAVKETDRGEGVLMLVDMGSLYYFEEKIIEKSKIKVKTIDMVSTPLVLDAVRKANFLEMDLNTIYSSLRYNNTDTEIILDATPKKSVENKAIVTICSTGEGTALRLKEMVQSYISETTDELIEVIPISTVGLKESMEQLQKKYSIIVSIGVKNPRIDAPFISLEEFIEGKGERVIEQAIQNRSILIKNSHSDVILRSLCEDGMKKILIYLNPYRATSSLLLFCQQLERDWEVHFKNTTTIRIVLHTAFAMERAIVKDELIYRGEITKEKTNMIKMIKKCFEIIKKQLNIMLSDDELYYIADLLFEEFKEKCIKKKIDLSI
ncbi:sigma 54-interacting transcriptional regulator [Niallia sp. 03133]|uniref:sigma 54-interacting transcriptional regulator n=1 Tax=Niallia sp. 03133 TaxID=3458060 RepID=UPI00404431EE